MCPCASSGHARKVLEDGNFLCVSWLSIYLQGNFLGSKSTLSLPINTFVITNKKIIFFRSILVLKCAAKYNQNFHRCGYCKAFHRNKARYIIILKKKRPVVTHSYKVRKKPFIYSLLYVYVYITTILEIFKENTIFFQLRS